MPSPTPSNDFVDSAAATLPKAGSGVRAVSGEPLFKAGDRVADNIELVSVLGVGGMGDVWLANHIGLGTAVAVKFMSAALAHDLALVERFAREAKLASRIKSRHVVQIFDFATTREGIPYIVMELIEGETLGSRIQRDAKLGLEETSRIVVQLCRALTKAHEIGIIHRDMKPDNILLGQDEGELFVRILDFGIAKLMDAPKGVTDAGATMGTPSYMSPEQLFRPADVDHGSDLWALGVMTYQCLTGRLPFQGESFAAVCVAINEGTFPLASTLNPEIPQAMDAWFGQALALSPGERFASAKEMSDAYLRMLEEANQLPIWAVHPDILDEEALRHSGATRAVHPRRVAPAQHVRGSRRRAVAVVAGAVTLVAVGFLSRDARLGQFVNTHLPSWRTPSVDGPRAEPVSQTSSVAARVESPNLAAKDASPMAVAPRAKLVLPRPLAVTSSVGSQVPAAVDAATVRLLSAPDLPTEAVALASSESDSNPYSESSAPLAEPASTAASLDPAAQPPSP
jgi:serine/threonine protein kinase